MPKQDFPGAAAPTCVIHGGARIFSIWEILNGGHY